MKTLNNLSPYRIFLLLKKDLYYNYRSILAAAAAVSAVVIILALFSSFGNSGSAFHYNLFKNILFLGGFITAGRAFTDLHKKETVQDYLMLPASLPEKFLTRLVLVSVLYAAAAAAGYTVLSYLAELLNYMLFEKTNALFNPISINILALLPDFFILQSIFFLGGLYFRKNSFIKTIAFCGAVIIVFLLILASAARFIFHDIMISAFSINSGNFRLYGETLTAFEKEAAVVSGILKWTYLLAAAPFCWLTAFFRFREAEVRHGI